MLALVLGTKAGMCSYSVASGCNISIGSTTSTRSSTSIVTNPTLASFRCPCNYVVLVYCCVVGVLRLLSFTALS